MSEPSLTDFADEPELTVEDVARRVEDWLRRLADLYALIREWAAARGWSADAGESVPMREELMTRFGIPTRQQPTLLLRDPNGVEIWVKPKGLWVIGANGRVDLYSRRGAFTMVDISEHYDPPQWILHRVGKGRGRPFVPDQLAELV